MSTKVKIAAIVLVVSALVGGYAIGRQQTIKQAELYNVTEDGYYIGFGDEVHAYIFEK